MIRKNATFGSDEHNENFLPSVVTFLVLRRTCESSSDLQSYLFSFDILGFRRMARYSKWFTIYYRAYCVDLFRDVNISVHLFGMSKVLESSEKISSLPSHPQFAAKLIRPQMPVQRESLTKE